VEVELGIAIHLIPLFASHLRRPTWTAEIFPTGVFRFYRQTHTILTVKEMAWAARVKLPGSAKNMGVCYILETLEI